MDKESTVEQRILNDTSTLDELEDIFECCRALSSTVDSPEIRFILDQEEFLREQFNNRLKEAKVLQEEERKNASKRISSLIKQAEGLIREAEGIAEDTGVSFSFGVAYGMGGTYVPKNDSDWNESSCSEDDVGWMASSHSC